MHRQLVREGFARIQSFRGLDINALAAEARAALERDKPDCTTVCVSKSPLQHLNPVLNDTRVRRAAAMYLGRDARLTGYMTLRLGKKVNTSIYRSGEWHHDRCGRRLKLFIYLDSVGPKDHPTLIVRGSHRLSYFLDAREVYTRFRQDFVRKAFASRISQMLGPRGGGFLFDTNSVHRGDIDGMHEVRDAIVVEFDEGVEKLKIQPACMSQAHEYRVYESLRSYWLDS